jgi:hypothetical protein
MNKSIINIPNIVDISRFIDISEMINIHNQYIELNEIEKIKIINDMYNNLVLDISWIEISVIILLIDDMLIEKFLKHFNISSTILNIKLKMWEYPNIATDLKWNNPEKWSLKSVDKFYKTIKNILKNASINSVKKEILHMINHNIIDKKFDKNHYSKFKKDYDTILKSDQFRLIECMSGNILKNKQIDINMIIFYTCWQIRLMNYQFSKFYDYTELIIPIIADINSNYKDIIIDVLEYVDKKN